MSSNRLFDEKIKINEELISKFNAINKENQAIIKENNLLKIDIFNLKKETSILIEGKSNNSLKIKESTRDSFHFVKDKQTRIETNENKIDITKEETDNEKQLNYEHSQTDLKEKLNYLECEKKRLFESKLSLIKNKLLESIIDSERHLKDKTCRKSTEDKIKDLYDKITIFKSDHLKNLENLNLNVNEFKIEAVCDLKILRQKIIDVYSFNFQIVQNLSHDYAKETVHSFNIENKEKQEKNEFSKREINEKKVFYFEEQGNFLQENDLINLKFIDNIDTDLNHETLDCLKKDLTYIERLIHKSNLEIVRLLTLLKQQGKKIDYEIFSTDKIIKELEIDREQSNIRENIEIITNLCEIQRSHNNSKRNLLINYFENTLFKENDHLNDEYQQKSNHDFIKENESLRRFSKKILIEYLSSLIIIENSINLNSLNQMINKDFSSYMKIIFSNKKTSESKKIPSPISFIHEYIEDIYLKIYDEFRSLNSKLLIDENYINQELISIISNKIIDSNLLKTILNLNENYKQLNDFESNINELKKTFPDEKICELLSDPTIKTDLENKICLQRKSTLKDLEGLVEQFKNTIYRGSIFFNNMEVYSFKKSELDFNLGQDDLYVGESINCYEKLKMLIFKLKYENKKIKSIILCDTFKKKDLDLSQLVHTIIHYCTNLNSFTLNDSVLTESQFNSLLGILDCSNLLNLNLNYNSLNNSNILSLSDSLSKNEMLVSLHLSGNLISSNGLIHLSNFLQSNKRLEQLFIASNKLDNLGIKVFIETLISKNKSVNYLNLADNNLKNDDIMLICMLIKKNRDISFLNLSGNPFTSETIIHLSRAMASNNRLKVLYLENVNLNREMLFNLNTSFQHVKITELHLSSNQIINKCSDIIGSLLKGNKNLRTLALRNCSLSPKSLITIIDSLNKSSIEKLDLRENEQAFNNQSINVLINQKNNILIILSRKDVKDKVEMFNNSLKFNLI